MILALAHGPLPAREAAARPSEMAERLHYPIGRAAALEAQRRCPPRIPRRAPSCSAEAEAAWRALDAALEATRAA